MSNAYNCECNGNYAHNKCLLGVEKCPTCRKVSKPKLYIFTGYDRYLWFLLDWLKRDISNFKKLNLYMIYILLFTTCLLFILDRNKESINHIMPPKSSLSLCFAIVIGTSYGGALYIIIVFNDYIMKYWLYNLKTNRYDVFTTRLDNTLYQQEIFRIQRRRLLLNLNIGMDIPV